MHIYYFSLVKTGYKTLAEIKLTNNSDGCEAINLSIGNASLNCLKYVWGFFFSKNIIFTFKSNYQSTLSTSLFRKKRLMLDEMTWPAFAIIMKKYKN